MLPALSLPPPLFVLLISSGLPVVLALYYVRAPCYLQDFWGVLDDTGHVHNWDGSVSPVVHQLDHFLGEVRVCVVLFCSVLSAAHARTDQLFPL